MKLNKTEKVKVLLNKYRAGLCSDSELKELVRFMEEDESLYELLDETVNQDWRERALKAEKHVNVSNKKRNIRSNKITYWVAAATVLFLIAAGSTWWIKMNTGTIIYHTEYGERQKIELPDGSQVELNANSQLTWNKNWKQSGIRSVVLDGEAYFDVVKKAGKEFHVTANETVVKVLGTSFNVSNRRGETEVFLHEGKVKLEISDQEQLTMAPGEKVAYEERSSKITKTNRETLRSAAAWKTGVISFQKVPLKDIIPELNDIYGIQLICRNPTLNEKVMDVGVPYMDWGATKASLELAMKVKINNIDGKYIIEPKE